MAYYSIFKSDGGRYHYVTDASSRESAFIIAIGYITDGDPAMVQWGDGERYILSQKMKRGTTGSNITDYTYYCFVDLYNPEYTGNTKTKENAIYIVNPLTGKFSRLVKTNAYPVIEKTPRRSISSAGSKNTSDWLIYGKRKGEKKFKVFTGDALSTNLIYGMRWPYSEGDKVLRIVDELNRENPDYTFVRRRGKGSLFGN